jgi:hypothetical protein
MPLGTRDPGLTRAHTSGASPVQAKLGKSFTFKAMYLAMGRMAYILSPRLMNLGRFSLVPPPADQAWLAGIQPVTSDSNTQLFSLQCFLNGVYRFVRNLYLF